MNTVRVYFANLAKTLTVKVNPQTSEVLRWLYRDGDTFCCHRNGDDAILLDHTA